MERNFRKYAFRTKKMNRVLQKVLLIWIVALFSSISIAADLIPRSPAPMLSIKTWYKGQPIKALNPDKIYIVEFWATWCGPCRESMPHLTELAKKNPDVTVIGVSVFEEDNGKNIKEFVKEAGSKMGYHVGYSGNTDGMAASWLRAAKQSVIPAAFIVQNNVIQWIGHPATLENVLKQIKEKKWTIAHAKKLFASSNIDKEDHQAARTQLGDAQDLLHSGKFSEALKILQDIEIKFPSHRMEVMCWRWTIEMKKDHAAWEKHLAELVSKKDPKEMQALNFFVLVQGSNSGNPAEGIRVLNLLLPTVAPDDYHSRLNAAMFYDAIGKPEEALKYMDQTLVAFKLHSDSKDNKIVLEAFERRRSAYMAKLKG
jgi:thiol-disulfide isomerase/thioredoxin